MLDFLATKTVYGASADVLINKIQKNILDPVITVFFAVAIAIFLYGVVEFIISQANDEKKSDGKQHMLWGIIGLTIMVGAKAIVNWIS